MTIKDLNLRNNEQSIASTREMGRVIALVNECEDKLSVLNACLTQMKLQVNEAQVIFNEMFFETANKEETLSKILPAMACKFVLEKEESF